MSTRREVLMAGVAVGTAARLAGAGEQPFRVAVAGDYEDRARRADWTRLGAGVEVVFFNKPFDSARATSDALRHFDAVALMRERIPMSREIIERLPQLKLIVFTGPSNATLDYQAAIDHHVTVCNSGAARRPAGTGPVGGGSSGGSSPAELALALILACAWRIPAADRLIRSGGWAFQPSLPLHGKVLGIAGYGNLGKPVARYGNALGMKVLGWSRSLTDEMARADNIGRADLETLMRQSDVISVHLPLTEATRGIIGAREIGWMKPGVIFINTARAGIVDQGAMIDALRNGKIAMGGLDVFDQEPLPKGHPLLKLTNVVMTPHIGFVSEDSLAGMYDGIIGVLAAYRSGKVQNLYVPTPRT